MLLNDYNKTSQNKEQVKYLGEALLKWYDHHRRILPWRALPDQKPEPYHVWLSEIMLQQTVVKAVIPYFLKFVEKWPTIHDLAEAKQDEVMEAWAGLGYYARARNLYKCAGIVSSEYNGYFPDTLKELKKLPGIGDYTSAAIAAIAFNKPATVVDGNVERVISRLYAITEPLPDSKKYIYALTRPFSENFKDRPGDLAQAMMDLGASICIPKMPRCVLCPLQEKCLARKQGIAENLPAKRTRKSKPQKHGYIYYVTDNKGNILLHKRPEKGLLGGMYGFPTSDWVLKDKDKVHAEFSYNLQPEICKRYKVLHSFTHFDLELTGCRVKLSSKKPKIEQNGFKWIPENNIRKNIFPTVFRKFYQLIQ